MKKILKQLVAAILLINFALTLNLVASAQDPCEGDFTSPLCKIQEIGNSEETNLPDFYATGQHPDAPPDFAQPGVGTATSPIYFAIDFFRLAISGLAIVYIIVNSLRLVSTDQEEEFGKIKNHLIYGVMGLLLIQLADVIVKRAFFGEQGEAFQDVATAQIYAEETVSQIRGLIGFAEIFLGAFSVLIFVYRGFILLTGVNDEEAISKAKTHIIYATFGIVTVLLSEVVLRQVIFPKAGEALPDVDKGKHIIVAIANYLASFITIISFAVLFYGGYQYVAGAGSDEATERLKKIITGAVISLIIALGAFAAVNTLIKFETPADTAEVNLPSSQ